MILTNVSASQQKLLALMILVLFLIIGLSLTVLPIWLVHQHYQTSITDTYDRLIRYKKIASQKSALEQQLSQLQQHLSSQGFYLKSNTNALASAELADIVKQVIRSSQGELISTRNVATAKEDETDKAMGLQKITVRVKMQVNINSLQKILYKLEMGQQPLLLLEQLQVRAITYRSSRRAKKQLEGRLDVSFDISGYRQILAEESS